ncbi:MAG TPA: hypothetical protein VL547_19985 [Dinghuibacter sp.]|uniref:hypothetical protein n=1 Tax=Dinghuibacter sp. TaxID=2024697 RepID=UPI002C332125|nr:hypothetical protein [Dinghuibacter sp.]HTJ14334.1 hypothetical protein [Dinghuibacter sp.]
MTINRSRLPWFFITIALSLYLYLKETLPLLSGYAAKVCGSAVFVSHRSPDSVVAHDLRHFPFFLVRALWWLNGGRWPHLPADAYAAEGNEGQYVCVIPSKDLVVVHLALFPARPDIDGLVNRLLHACFQ